MYVNYSHLLAVEMGHVLMSKIQIIGELSQHEGKCTEIILLRGN